MSYVLLWPAVLFLFHFTAASYLTVSLTVCTGFSRKPQCVGRKHLELCFINHSEDQFFEISIYPRSSTEDARSEYDSIVLKAILNMASNVNRNIALVLFFITLVSTFTSPFIALLSLTTAQSLICIKILTVDLSCTRVAARLTSRY